MNLFNHYPLPPLDEAWVDRELFHELVKVLAQAEQQKKKSGRPSLSLENQLYSALSYWREYCTFFHLGLSFGVHESNAQRITCHVEERLAASGYLDLVKPSVSHDKGVGADDPLRERIVDRKKSEYLSHELKRYLTMSKTNPSARQARRIGITATSTNKKR
ncbi:transposase family protein [uncultured Thiothrix sp.]|uniref:helix-turn-helix domain-containing protein n=1 Tax=uncultured Thiothrix sp. TaxID=223185 RepID=UPI002625D721|nr:transposase family protein [uncultured Thiothrix sp.]